MFQPGATFQGAFPHYGNSPAIFSEFPDRKIIIHEVASNLVRPELLACGWPFEEMAVMPVPKASMDEHHCPVLRENYVRLSRKILCVKPVPQACCMKGAADQQFRLCVAAFDGSHIPASCLLIVDVRHDQAALRWLRALTKA